KAALTLALAQMGLDRLEQAQNNLLEAREEFARNGNTTFSAQADVYLAELAIRRGDAAEASFRSASALRAFSRQKLSMRSAHSRLLCARSAYALGNRAKAFRMARATLRALENLLAPAVTYQRHHLIG